MGIYSMVLCPWTDVILVADVRVCICWLVSVCVWERLGAVFLKNVLIYFSLPPHNCFTVTIPKQCYKLCFVVADVHLGRPPHLQPGKNTAQLWTIPNTHTYSCASKLFTMCSLALAHPLSRCSAMAFSFFSVHLQPLHPLPCSFPPSLVFVLRLMTLSVWYKAL